LTGESIHRQSKTVAIAFEAWFDSWSGKRSGLRLDPQDNESRLLLLVRGEILQETWAILSRVMLAFALAVSGGGVSVSRAISHQRLCRLISLAAGTLLGVTLFSIVPESLAAMPLWQLAVALASGYVLFFLISKYVFHVCPACAASHFDEATKHRFGEIATAMVIALAVHSTMDGVAVAAGHAAEMSSWLDPALVLAVCVHKVPEGLALGALLLGAGYRRGIALCWVAAVEATTVFGGLLGLWVSPRMSGVWLDALLAHVGGGFLFLALHAVFGELIKHGKKLVLVNFALGLSLIAVLSLLMRLL
jgi:ZIP family zinc transporter